jgi:hypothetical protein
MPWNSSSIVDIPSLPIPSHLNNIDFFYRFCKTALPFAVEKTSEQGAITKPHPPNDNIHTILVADFSFGYQMFNRKGILAVSTFNLPSFK